MGYGLVAVPRQLWRTADIKGQEKASFHKAGLQADRAIAAKKCVTANLQFCSRSLRNTHVACYIAHGWQSLSDHILCTSCNGGSLEAAMLFSPGNSRHACNAVMWIWYKALKVLTSSKSKLWEAYKRQEH